MVKTPCLIIALMLTLMACSEKKAPPDGSYYKEDNYRLDDNLPATMLFDTDYLYHIDELKIYKDTLLGIFGVRGLKLAYQTKDKNMIRKIIPSISYVNRLPVHEGVEAGDVYLIYMFDNRARKSGFIIIKPCKSGNQYYASIKPQSGASIHYSGTIIPLLQELKVIEKE